MVEFLRIIFEDLMDKNRRANYEKVYKKVNGVYLYDDCTFAIGMR